MNHIKSILRQLLVGWITVLNAVPDINMLDHLPEFLDGLFNMLSDGNREIKQAADNALTGWSLKTKLTEVQKSNLNHHPDLTITRYMYHT